MSRISSTEIAWKPVLMLMVMIYAIVCIPLGWMWFQEMRTIAKLPVVTVATAPSSFRNCAVFSSPDPPSSSTLPPRREARTGRPQANASCGTGVGQPAVLQRQAAAPDAAGQLVTQPDQVGDGRQSLKHWALCRSR